jgi:signal transduction histidine kinase
MKNFRIYLNLLALLGILLILITVGQSYLEYKSSRAAVLKLFTSQAETMISSIARAGEKGLIAYQSLQMQVSQRLFTAADAIDILNRSGSLNKSNIKELADLSGLADISVFDNNSGILWTYPEMAAGKIDSIFIGSIIRPFIASGVKQEPIGFIDGFDGGDKLFAVLYRTSRGGAILAAIDATELQNQRRAFGAGSIIEDMSQNTGVRYAGILNAGMIMVATRNFPVSQMDDWYGGNFANPDSVLTRIHPLDNPDNLPQEVFEAMGPFDVAGQNYGMIVIGLDTTLLNLLTSKLKRDVFWHSLLSLLITLIAVGGVVIWNNYRMVSRRYDEIKGEVQKLEADKAVKARLASMGELAGGVAHEIRNPLNAIRVIIQRLQREFSPESDKGEYLELTDVVKRETDRINESVEQFLKMARPPALQKSRSNLNKCLEHVLELFEPRATEQNIKVTKDLDNLPDINLDSKLCGQAILNILENALDAIKESGNIVIRTYTKQKKIFVEIEDDGPGIPDELKSRVFDMYFTTKDSGTGMGLPSVLMTVKEHGGSVEILDSPMGGALFRMEFSIE